MRRLFGIMIMFLPSFCFAQRVDDRVIVISDPNAQLEFDDKIVGTVDRGNKLRVDRVEGESYWVMWKGVSGWIKSDDVIPYSQGIDYFTDAIQQNATSENFSTRGMLWADKGEHDLAIADFNEAISVDPQAADNYSNRGLSWREKGELDKSMSDFNHAVRLDPQFSDSYHNRGLVWRDKGDFDKAIIDFNEAIRLDPKDSDSYSQRGITWVDKGDFDKAFKDHNNAIVLDPKNAPAYLNRGIAWAARDDYEKALSDYNQAIRLDSSNALMYYNRATLWYRKGDFGKAIRDLNETIRIDPNMAHAYNNRGYSKYKSGDIAGAIQDYNEAIRVSPEHLRAIINLARIYAFCSNEQFRNGDKAVENATKACELTDWEDVESLSILAAAYAEKRMFEEAIRWQKKTIEISPAEYKRAYRLLLERYTDGKPYREK